jgi:hypothetical protein
VIVVLIGLLDVFVCILVCLGKMNAKEFQNGAEEKLPGVRLSTIFLKNFAKIFLGVFLRHEFHQGGCNSQKPNQPNQPRITRMAQITFKQPLSIPHP